jgi:hypothetical protein
MGSGSVVWDGAIVMAKYFVKLFDKQCNNETENHWISSQLNCYNYNYNNNNKSKVLIILELGAGQNSHVQCQNGY